MKIEKLSPTEIEIKSETKDEVQLIKNMWINGIKINSYDSYKITSLNGIGIEIKSEIPEIPYGSTCHYERINKKWYVVWGADFPNDNSGRKLVADNEALLLEIGYQTAVSD